MNKIAVLYEGVVVSPLKPWNLSDDLCMMDKQGTNHNVFILSTDAIYHQETIENENCYGRSKKYGKNHYPKNI
ncbi:MAG: hypothetical protein BV459_02760 [Thermoplasmata archaeon M11B2D]|nr:MAG: hypothetical protein BV459_02760 [Thermoplasmata archaeon M11B2D]